jgi:hypothetical protein
LALCAIQMGDSRRLTPGANTFPRSINNKVSDYGQLHQRYRDSRICASPRWIGYLIRPAAGGLQPPALHEPDQHQRRRSNHGLVPTTIGRSFYLGLGAYSVSARGAARCHVGPIAVELRELAPRIAQRRTGSYERGPFPGAFPNSVASQAIKGLKCGASQSNRFWITTGGGRRLIIPVS